MGLTRLPVVEQAAGARRAALERVHAATRARVSPAQWAALVEAYAGDGEAWPGAAFPEHVAARAGPDGLPPYLAALAEVERAREEVARAAVPVPDDVDALTANPSAVALELDWRLGALGGRGPAPAPGQDVVFVWRDPRSGQVRAGPAGARELLAVKMAVEAIPVEEVEAASGVPRARVQAALQAVARTGLVLLPGSRLRRDAAHAVPGAPEAARFRVATTFTLQWHLTNACELRCAHCYDRSQPSPLTLPQALRVVEDLQAFCRAERVRGHVMLSGGNPMLFPGFLEVYRAIAAAGLEVSILGNPTTRRRLERLVAVRAPHLYQVSLEGLEAHDDAVRGPGHFQRTLAFLPHLKELGVYSAVMLTLTRDNLDQVLPLAEVLRGRTDQLTFTRLAQVGEGARLSLPSPEEYRRFLERYLAAADADPLLGFKENLLNVVRRHRGDASLHGGCTGFGCGAAFNCLALLPDGEAHACRKFPSPVGNVLRDGLQAVYRSPAAARYRAGTAGCAGCDLRHACGGCLAVVHGLGADPLAARDPFCFYAAAPPLPAA